MKKATHTDHMYLCLQILKLAWSTYQHVVPSTEGPVCSCLTYRTHTHGPHRISIDKHVRTYIHTCSIHCVIILYLWCNAATVEYLNRCQAKLSTVSSGRAPCSRSRRQAERTVSLTDKSRRAHNPSTRPLVAQRACGT